MRFGKRLRAVVAGPSTGRERRPGWLRATDGLAPAYLLEHEFNGTNRATHRAQRLAPSAAQAQMFRSIREATRQDTAAVRRRAHLAGCHGRSVAPLMADDLRDKYGPKPTPAQARRIRKADHVEAGR
jgi:hypothetical protein